MTTYRILASYVSYVHADIEANNIEEAKEIAYNMDGSDFKNDGLGDWNIDQIIDVIKLKGAV